MKELNANCEALKEATIKYLLNPYRGEEGHLDEPYLISSGGSYSKRQLAEAVRNNEEVGINLVNGLVLLTLDLLERNKEKVEGFEKV